MNHAATANGLTLDDACVIGLISQYKETVAQLVERAGIDKDEVHLSEHSLSLALAEARTDLDFMSLRRRPDKGISPAKIAGIITFRLSRFAPINVVGAALENEVALKLNDLSAFALSLKAILHLDIKDIGSSHISKELHYTLARRHTNQETLGLVFEALAPSA